MNLKFNTYSCCYKYNYDFYIIDAVSTQVFYTVFTVWRWALKINVAQLSI